MVAPAAARGGLPLAARVSRFLKALACAAIVTIPIWPLGARAESQGVAEPALKAAFLLNFTKFTEWPDDVLAPAAPIVLCVADTDVAAALDSIVTGRSVNQHALTIRRVKLDDTVRTCGLLYTSKLDERRIAQLMTALGSASVLTVGEAQDFALRGGMIGLFVDDGRMRFAINREAVQRTRLKLSAQLLTLAKIVKDGP